MLKSLVGAGDVTLRLLERLSNVKIIANHDKILLLGEEKEINRVEEVLMQALKVIKDGGSFGEREVEYFLREKEADASAILTDVILKTPRGKSITPRTEGQRRYVMAMRKSDLTLAIGPAGTGKTYLAVAVGVYLLKEKLISRIILVRPVLEAGERLGYLPGDILQKVDPYFRPLYDSLYDMVESEQVQRYFERNTIEVAPLAYMRGRTFNDSFVILDEAQNTTLEQMKMFLTRMGFGSKFVVTGDITQVDLPKGVSSGLVQASKILSKIPGIETVYLTERDVVRHPLVQKIIRSYELYEKGELK